MQTTLLDSQVLADRWDMEPTTLRQWRWQGKGPKFTKIGGKVRYRLKDVEAYEEQQCRNSTSDTPTPRRGA